MQVLWPHSSDAQPCSRSISTWHPQLCGCSDRQMPHHIQISVLTDDEGAFATQFQRDFLQCVSCRFHDKLPHRFAASEGNLQHTQAPYEDAACQRKHQRRQKQHRLQLPCQH